jgi:uncharacterized protein YndB with AHSA1/START domain
MAFVAEAWIDIDVPPEVAFDALADHSRWKEWMPRSFAVASRADSPHHLGKRFAMKVAGMPVASSIEVTALDRPRTLTWSGGQRGVLRGEHEFRFASDGKGGTRVHSHETWSGALAPLLRPFVKRAAEKIGREQLEGLARACAATTRR